MLKKLYPIIFFTCSLNTYAVQKENSPTKNGIDNPSLLTTHHFGIFSSRINSNFKFRPETKITLDLNYASGNTFHPFVEGYFPEDPEIRKAFSNTIWYHRSFNFIDQETTPADYMNIIIDAIIKEFKLGINIPLSQQHELQIKLRSYFITNGKHPFSFISSDETLEWFHSNIAGGEDPFGRRYYGLNQVNFRYTDRAGRVLELHNNDFFISGIELNHFYYPKLSINKTKSIFINFGSHLGINTSQFNSSLDFGISGNAIKNLKLKNNYALNMGIGMSVLRKNLIDFKTVVDLGNNPYLGTFEGDIELTKFTKKGNYNAFGINYQSQSRYNKKEEADYYHLKGKWKEIKGGWHNGVATLYDALSHWSFIYTYGHSKYKLALYLKEDFRVNNAPDIQIGGNLKIPIRH